MTTYLLLRNNKESAPCSLDTIKNLGLRSDDLVWVEGQSVCWMNPDQIKELKEFVGMAPVEEVIPQRTAVPKPKVEPSPKNVFVSLPVKPKQAAAIQEPEMVETKYSKPLDEIKEIYLKNLEKKYRGFQVPPQLRKAGVYAGLILVGIIAGVLIKQTGAQKDPVLSAAETKQYNGQQVSGTNEDVVQDPANVDSQSENNLELSNQMVVNTSSSEQKKPALTQAVNTGQTTIVNPEPSIPAVPVPDTSSLKVEEEKKEEEKPVRKISLNEIRSQVSVKTNDYDVGSFGGIKNLKLTVTNHSKYELDKVAVEVQYLKPMNEFLRSELVSVSSLSPGETKVIEVKKSNRGVKVNCKVSGVRSKEFSDGTAGL